MTMAGWPLVMTEEWRAALDLVAELDDDLGLPEFETSLYLRLNEVLHAEVDANLWWYGAVDVTYERNQFLLFGGLPSLAMTAAASAFGNHRRRRAAEALAAPQWRPGGNVPVLLTDQRLLLLLDGTLTSIELDDIIDTMAAPQAQRLTILAAGRQPLELHGAWVPYLAVALQFLLHDEVLHLSSPAHHPPVAS